MTCHHSRAEISHCVRLHVGPWEVPLCARCLGLYPVLFGTILILLSTQISVPSPGSVILVAVAPALMDWTADRLGLWTSGNGVRLATGAIAGLGLGAGLWEHMRDPFANGIGAAFLGVSVFVVSIEGLSFYLRRR